MLFHFYYLLGSLFYLVLGSQYSLRDFGRFTNHTQLHSVVMRENMGERERERERERESDTYHISRVLVARKGFSARLELAAGSVLPVGYRSVLVSEMLPNSAAPTG